MNRADIYNGGAESRSAFADMINIVAGSGSDNIEYNSDWVTRRHPTLGLAKSMKVIIVAEATLAAAASMTLLANLQDAADGAGAGAADYGTPLAVTTVLSSTPGGTVGDTIELDINLSSAKEFVRLQYTPNLSAGATDTARIAVAFEFYGYQRGPTTKSLI